MVVNVKGDVVGVVVVDVQDIIILVTVPPSQIADIQVPSPSCVL